MCASRELITIRLCFPLKQKDIMTVQFKKICAPANEGVKPDATEFLIRRNVKAGPSFGKLTQYKDASVRWRADKLVSARDTP